MQILYFADIRFPLERANGIQTVETCHALGRRGHAVTLVVRPDTTRPARDPFAFYALPPIPALRIIRVPVAGPPVARRLRYLAQALGRSMMARPDLVLTRDLGVASLLLGWPAGARSPVVYESHGFAPLVGVALPTLLSGTQPASPRKARRLGAREERVWRRADGYVTITRSLADEMVDRFGSRGCRAVIPDGVRLDSGRRFVALPAGSPPLVAYAGNLYPWKGADVLLEALAALPSVTGLIVGGHPREADLDVHRRRAAELGLASRVRFAGAVPPREVASYLGRADVLVLPNTRTHVSSRYTSPLKLFEYLAAGKPIVASDLPAIREVLEDDRNAVLVEAGRADALASGIARVLGDPALAGRLARQAFLDAEEYSWDRRAERYDLLFAAMRPAAAGPRAMTPTGQAGTTAQP